MRDAIEISAAPHVSRSSTVDGLAGPADSGAAPAEPPADAEERGDHRSGPTGPVDVEGVVEAEPPGPIVATAHATTAMAAAYSQPSLIMKKPLLRCTA